MSVLESETSGYFIRIVYSSAGVREFSRQQILTLLQRARKRNAEMNVTGMLLYEAGSFFQVLEGPPQSVLELYERISNDKRHVRMTKIIQERATRREFAQWSMGYSGASLYDLQKIDGLNDFFESNICFTRLGEGRAKVLLSAFKEGKWRASLG